MPHAGGRWQTIRHLARSPAARAGLRVARPVAVAAALVAMPFWLLVRASLYAHAALGLHAWLALAVGAAAAGLALALPTGWLWHRLTGRRRFREIASRLVFPAVLAFCLSSLVSIADAHTKSAEIHTLYTQLHPILRISLSTLVLVDSGLVITDIERRPGDYARMGLSENERSLHYPQSDGWVHAVDLRTRGRGMIRNGLTRLYLFAMGLDTLRHTGNADHLHVSLPR